MHLAGRVRKGFEDGAHEGRLHERPRLLGVRDGGDRNDDLQVVVLSVGSRTELAIQRDAQIGRDGLQYVENAAGHGTGVFGNRDFEIVYQNTSQCGQGGGW